VKTNPDRPRLEDVWEQYQVTRDSIVQAAEHTKGSIAFASGTTHPRFFAMSLDEVEEFFRARLDETDRQACLSLVASAEAALCVDFWERVHGRKKDPVSRAFRGISRIPCAHGRLKVRLDEHILQTWAEMVPQAKARVGELRGALKYRHWLAHGRWWVPKFGRQYDPTGLLRIITELFKKVKLTAL